jgi:hypothetical protein
MTAQFVLASEAKQSRRRDAGKMRRETTTYQTLRPIRRSP